MLLTLETSEHCSTLDVRENLAVPRVGELLDWNFGGVRQIPPGIYRVEAVTHQFGSSFSIHLQLAWVRERAPR
jgi:hypothetical protein